jgi:hypothetical protein
MSRASPSTAGTVLEVRLVPRVAAEGFLNSYIWTIPLSPDGIRRLTAATSGALHRRRRLGNEIRALVAAHVRRHGMPVFGELADYCVDFDHAFLRIPLNRR